MPHTFIVVFVVMLPVLIQSGDPMKAWRAGLAWAFIIGIIVLIGAFFGPYIRRITPRAALLGALAGISITFISMRPAAQMWQAAWIGFIAFAFILLGFLGSRRMPFGAPVALLAVGVWTAVAWIAVALDRAAILTTTAVGDSIGSLALQLPFPSGDVLTGLEDIAPLLASAIPLGIYNFTEGMTNVESAAAAGDRYSVRQVLSADGLGAVVGSFLGSPFPPAVYIGHPGWKQAGGRIGYSLVRHRGGRGLHHRPGGHLPGGVPGPVAGARPAVHRPGHRRAGLQHRQPALRPGHRPGDAAQPRGVGSRPDRQHPGQCRYQRRGSGGRRADLQRGHLRRAQTVRTGSVLVGILLGAIAAFVIDRRLVAASVTALIAAGLSFVGLINAYAVAWNASQQITIGYLGFAAVLGWLAWAARNEVNTELDDGLLFVNGTLMRGLELHGNLEGAEFVEEVATAPVYRVHSIGDVHPGMYRVTEGETGASIPGELYTLPTEVLLKVVEREPAGLYRGPVELADGRTVPGILYDREMAQGHPEIAAHGGWRNYRQATSVG